MSHTADERAEMVKLIADLKEENRQLKLNQQKHAFDEDLVRRLLEHISENSTLPEFIGILLGGEQVKKEKK